MYAGSSNTVTWRSWDGCAKRKTNQKPESQGAQWLSSPWGRSSRQDFIQSKTPEMSHFGLDGGSISSQDCRFPSLFFFFLICISSHYQDPHLPNTWLGSFSSSLFTVQLRARFCTASPRNMLSEISPAARSPVGHWCPLSHPQPSCARAAAAVGISPPQAAVFAPEVLQNGVTEKVLKLHF